MNGYYLTSFVACAPLSPSERVSRVSRVPNHSQTSCALNESSPSRQVHLDSTSDSYAADD